MLMLWEESMAQTVAEFLKNPAYKDWKLVALTGGYHIQYGFGVPKRAYRRVPHAYVTILPTSADIPDELKDREMDVKEVSIPLYAADFAWKIPYKILPPNRIKLGVGLEELEQGARVRSVTENSPAAKAGIRKNDVFLIVDGQAVGDVDSMVERLQTKNFGDKIAIKLRRDETEMTVEAVLQKPEEPKQPTP
jgi:predicted metalloprotease with PDZ domain